MIGNYNYGTGRRKNAVARVRIVPGTGKVTVNGNYMHAVAVRSTSISSVKRAA